jgi:hypothetical protein
LTAIPGAGRAAGGFDSTMASATANRGQGLDDIHHVTIRNVTGFCRGGHHIVRFLNTSGLRMFDVLLDGLLPNRALVGGGSMPIIPHLRTQ